MGLPCIPKRGPHAVDLSPSFQDIESLTMQLRQKELELEHIRSQPDHEKDQEIHRLRSALVEKERCDATRAVLCSSLAEEADQLRGQLSSTVKMCQDLLTRLDRGKEGGEVAKVVAQQRNSRAVGVMLGRLTVKLGFLGTFFLLLLHMFSHQSLPKLTSKCVNCRRRTSSWSSVWPM